MAGWLFNNARIAIAGDEDLKPLEQAPSFGCLWPGIADPHFSPHGDVSKPSSQGNMHGKGHEPRLRLDGT